MSNNKNRVSHAFLPTDQAMSAACASTGICGHFRPHTPELHILRHLCDRQCNVCLSAIVLK